MKTTKQAVAGIDKVFEALNAYPLPGGVKIGVRVQPYIYGYENLFSVGTAKVTIRRSTGDSMTSPYRLVIEVNPTRGARGRRFSTAKFTLTMDEGWATSLGKILVKAYAAAVEADTATSAANNRRDAAVERKAAFLAKFTELTGRTPRPEHVRIDHVTGEVKQILHLVEISGATPEIMAAKSNALMAALRQVAEQFGSTVTWNITKP